MEAPTFFANAEHVGGLHVLEGELPTQNENQEIVFRYLFSRKVLFKRVGNSPAKKVEALTILSKTVRGAYLPTPSQISRDPFPVPKSTPRQQKI